MSWPPKVADCPWGIVIYTTILEHVSITTRCRPHQENCITALIVKKEILKININYFELYLSDLRMGDSVQVEELDENE